MKKNSDIDQKKLPAGRNLGGEAAPDFHPMSPFPDGDGTCGAVGDFGIHITLRSFGNTTPSERNLVAKAFTEVARQINETITATAGNHPQH